MYRAFIFFTTGGAGYAVIELLWRGRTHIAMLLLGGICFTLIGLMRGMSPILRAALGAAVITAAELAAGVVLNLRLGLGIWDYSAEPFNFMGQICLKYTALWFALALFAGAAADGLDNYL